MKKLTIIVLTLLSVNCFAQNALRIAFYNTENLFDTFDDSLTRDDDFTPRGMKAWAKKKYDQKQINLFKAISALGGEKPPAAIGLCEVENAKVLRDLCFGTPLRMHKFRYIHHESHDPRGIDVALIYRPDVFHPLFDTAFPVVYPGDSIARTRDILYVKALIFDSDTIHLFINHFPSKFGGTMATESRRYYVGKLLRERINLILNENPQAHIIATGDFNDEPTDASIMNGLGAKCLQGIPQKNDLINLMCPFVGKQGSHKYQDEWSIIDQMIVSGNLLRSDSEINVKASQAYVFTAPFLLMEDQKHLGQKPFRTYNGARYMGGFSDHLPIYLDLVKNIKK